LDITKDRLYTFSPESKERKSAQTAIYRVLDALVRLVAPILSFTAEEVWEFMPKAAESETSVHLARFPERLVSTEELFESYPGHFWQRFFDVRDEVLKMLEIARKDKKIGKALEAKVFLELNQNDYRAFTPLKDSLKELFNVSQVELVESEKELVHITIAPADGQKCNRCWNYYADDGPQHVRQYGPWPNVCGRCAEALNQMGYKSLQESHA
jgi:isoleucyl-tRNA synthetase